MKNNQAQANAQQYMIINIQQPPQNDKHKQKQPRNRIPENLMVPGPMGQMLPPITTMAPMAHEVDWFFGINEWKMFDSRRCNLLENMMHHCNEPEFKMVYRDVICTVNYRTMTFYEDDVMYKLRRETSIETRQIRLGWGTWSFYNGMTWIQYDRAVQSLLEERLKHGETNFTISVHSKDYTFDLDQNTEVCDSLPLGGGDRKIITRDWMTPQQSQDLGKMKKYQESVYVDERRRLEERIKQQFIQKKQVQQNMKQQQRVYWNQVKRTGNSPQSVPQMIQPIQQIPQNFYQQQMIMQNNQYQQYGLKNMNNQQIQQHQQLPPEYQETFINRTQLFKEIQIKNENIIDIFKELPQITTGLENIEPPLRKEIKIEYKKDNQIETKEEINLYQKQNGFSNSPLQ